MLKPAKVNLKDGSPELKTRVEKHAILILDGYTIRDIEKLTNYSKTTIHKDITERLPTLNPKLYEQVRKQLDWNQEVRHLRGGEATRKKFMKEKG